MDRLKRFALKKTMDSLEKTLEAREHFQKRDEKKLYEKKIVKLKEYLSNGMFHDEDPNKRAEDYELIQQLKRIQIKEHLDSADKRFVDKLISDNRIA